MQFRLLASELCLRVIEVVQTREPGGPLAELLLFAVDPAQHSRTVLRPAIEYGSIVLSDPYADARAACQGLSNAKNILDAVSARVARSLASSKSSIYTFVPNALYQTSCFEVSL